MLLVLLVVLCAPPGQASERARELIQKLDADRIDERQAAEKELLTLGTSAIAELRREEKAATGEFGIRLRRVLQSLVLTEPSEEKRIVTLDEVKPWDPITFSITGLAAYEGKNDRAERVILQGRPGEDFDAVSKIGFTPDGKTLVYVAEREKKTYVVIGSRTFGPYDSVGSDGIIAWYPIVFASNGTHVAFRASIDHKEFMVLDGKSQEPFECVDHPVFSPDGAHFAYAANRGGAYTNSVYRVSGGKWCIVIDGKKGEEFESVATLTDVGLPSLSPTFSPDGSRTAYVAREGHKFFLVVDGRHEKPFDFVFRPTFSPDSLHVEFVASEGDQLVSIRDGKRLTDGGSPLAGVVYSSDGAHWATTTSDGKDRESLVRDGIKGPEFSFAFAPCFSADGKKLAYLAHEGDRALVVVDDVRGPSFDRAWAPTFGADGRDAIYVATQSKKQFVMRGSAKGEEFDEILILEGASLPPLKMIPGSSTVVYRARNGGTYEPDAREYRNGDWFVVVGDRKVGPFDRVWEPQVLSGNRKVGFGARKGRELWWKVVDAP